MQSNLTPMSDSDVIACNYNAIAPDARTTHASTGQTLFASVLDIEELSDGYGFQLPLDTTTLYKATDFIANERLCCPFFTFTLVVNESLWLRLTGTDEVKTFVNLNIVEALRDTGTLPDPETWIAAHTTSTADPAATRVE
jgi:hypothetical protein